MENPKSQDTVRSLTNYCNRQNSWLGENNFNLLDSEKQRKEFKHFSQPITFSSSSDLNPSLLASLLTLSLSSTRVIRNRVLWSVHNISNLPLLLPNALSLPKHVSYPWSTCFGVGTSVVCSVDIHADMILSMAYSSTSSLTSPLTFMSKVLLISGCLLVSLCLNFPLTSPSWRAFCLSQTHFPRGATVSAKGFSWVLGWVCWNPLELSVQNGTWRFEVGGDKSHSLLIFSTH